jgi:hypothetical protein
VFDGELLVSGRGGREMSGFVSCLDSSGNVGTRQKKKKKKKSRGAKCTRFVET